MIINFIHNHKFLDIFHSTSGSKCSINIVWWRKRRNFGLGLSSWRVPQCAAPFLARLSYKTGKISITAHSKYAQRHLTSVRIKILLHHIISILYDIIYIIKIQSLWLHLFRFRSIWLGGRLLNLHCWLGSRFSDL